MNSNDQALLEQMMDEEDGVTNRRSAIDRKYRLAAASTKLANSYYTLRLIKTWQFTCNNVSATL